MKVGEDDWCSQCMKWMPFDNNGNCITCGKHINTLLSSYTWLELYGVDLTEIQPYRGNF